MLITDGKGQGNKAGVNKNNELVVTTASAFHKAALRGDAFMWNTVDYNSGTDETLITVRNLSPKRLLVINRMYMYTDVEGIYDIHIQTVTTAFTTTSGAVIVGVNLNTSSNKIADADAISDETAIAAQGTIILTLRTNELTTDQFGIEYLTNDAIVLGTNGRIAIDSSAAAATCDATITGYYIDA